MWKGFLLGGLLVVLLSATATATAVLLEVDKASGLIGASRIAREVAPELTRGDVGGPRTIMILGSDHRSTEPGKAGNSDTILLVRLDPDKQSIALMSVPRDLKVDL